MATGTTTACDSVVTDGYWGGFYYPGIPANATINDLSFTATYTLPERKPTMLQELTGALKRALSPSLQAQYKAGFINGGLELTDKGKNELLQLLAVKYDAEFTARANEVIEECEKKCEKKCS